VAVKIANVDVFQSVLVDEQPLLKHWVIHHISVVVEAAKFKTREYGGPLEEKVHDFRSFFIVGYAKRREGCAAAFLQSSLVSELYNFRLFHILPDICNVHAHTSS
jgi:hypothetical protein